MKKFLLAITLGLSAFILKAQTVNDIPLKDIDVDYVEIVGTSKIMSTKLTIGLDFGQHTKMFSGGKETIVKDEDGKPVDFNSMIDALNFMSKHGFEFVTAYIVTVSNQNVYYYLLRHKKNDGTDKAGQ